MLESRKYFGGGTVEMIIAINDTWHAKKDTSIHDRLEDGTLPFHSIFALDHAMNVHERLYGANPMKFISHHTGQLSKILHDGVIALKHPNGLPLCRVYKDDSAVYGDPSVQGATIAFNVQRADGSLVGFEDVEEAADDRNIFIRSGSLCNPGGIASYLQWSPAEMKAAYAAGHRCSNPTQIMLGKPTGVVRVSLGAMSIAADVSTLLRFLEEVYIGPAQGTRKPTSALIAQPSSVSPPASPAFPPSLNIPHPLFVPSSRSNNGVLATPSTADTASEQTMWEPTTTALPQPQHPIPEATDRPKAPPFVPADYTKLRRPWEDEMRRQAQQYGGVGVISEIKVRELEEASMRSRNATPSVKQARKFGRSVVNLLRTKSHFADGR